jgi:hypothetical protein
VVGYGMHVTDAKELQHKSKVLKVQMNHLAANLSFVMYKEIILCPYSELLADMCQIATCMSTHAGSLTLLGRRHPHMTEVAHAVNHLTHTHRPAIPTQ